MCDDDAAAPLKGARMDVSRLGPGQVRQGRERSRIGEERAVACRAPGLERHVFHCIGAEPPCLTSK